MKLSIVIPHYRESEQVINHNLGMINAQIGVDFKDFEVILVSDGGAVKLNPDYLKQFSNLQITHICLEKNVFSGMARQAGIDIAKGEYIGFLDADDSYYSCDTLRRVWSSFDGTKKFIISDIIEEHYEDDGKIIWRSLGGCEEIVHGTFVQKSFLTEHNIRFLPEMTYHEDMYYTSVCKFYADKVERHYFPVAIWRASPTSMTRKQWHNYADNPREKYKIEHFILGISKIMDNHFDNFSDKLRAKMYIFTGFSWMSKFSSDFRRDIAGFLKKYEKHFVLDKTEYCKIYGFVKDRLGLDRANSFFDSYNDVIKVDFANNQKFDNQN